MFTCEGHSAVSILLDFEALPAAFPILQFPAGLLHDCSLLLDVST